MNTSLTVLIVDDNPTNLKLAADVLECDGHAVLRACDADQALGLLAKVRPDIILMDIEMPGMDGLTLTRLLKADQARRDIPVVALTAFAMKDDRQKAIDAGCCAYLTKPIETRRFAAQVVEIYNNENASGTEVPQP
jgi:CheY-like chemotaxis protein